MTTLADAPLPNFKTIHAIRWTKVLLNLELKRVATAVIDAGVAYESVAVRTADHLEGVRALREKRKPQFGR